ncbi:hypothetical protein PV11_06348 [Exophiala sideris]|uniref:Heterokaryon incompatibility domain-containing protein n=1 Tax=Exophiala sideris TaxID=1016849 RepID=A0A0D1Y779_9EURO|nr:hypothetical protein PV11_06348 [Exophiala sideris]
MRLLRVDDHGELSVTKDFVEDVPSYAILSHTEGELDEVTFHDLRNGLGKTKAGYAKLQFCSEQLRRDGFKYIWVDACCIDMSSSSELSEAINSMFRWYRDALKCYVYFADVSAHKRGYDTGEPTWESTFRQSRWFTRSWTIQELIAPVVVEFFPEGVYDLETGGH